MGDLSIFLMLSLSKHEEAPHPISVFPAKAGTLNLSLRRSSTRWIPAFAGNAVERVWMPLTQPSPPEGGEG